MTAQQHALATPCEGWDVAMLLDKMVTSAQLFAALCRGEQPGSDLNLLFPAPIGRADASGGFARGAAACRAAFVESKLEGEMMGPLGVMVPRRGGLNVRMMDCAINTWDLAVSIGATASIDAHSIEPLIEFATGFFPKVRERTDHPRFGDAAVEVGDAESALDRLVALSGRNPRWAS